MLDSRKQFRALRDKKNYSNSCVVIGEKRITLTRLFADDTLLGYYNQSVDQIKTVINLIYSN
jgi:hypothetical protein